VRIRRAILTFLVALSLAIAPLAVSLAALDQSVAASPEATASMHDCCDHDGMPAGPSKPMNECQASAGCLAKCFSFYPLEFSDVVPPALIRGAKSDFAATAMHAHAAAPPFRPPWP
jgi:hypothetical protein